MCNPRRNTWPHSAEVELSDIPLGYVVHRVANMTLKDFENVDEFKAPLDGGHFQLITIKKKDAPVEVARGPNIGGGEAPSSHNVLYIRGTAAANPRGHRPKKWEEVTAARVAAPRRRRSPF